MLFIYFCENAHQRANAILRCFPTRDSILLVNAFKTYVRPIVEYSSVIWSPHLKRDINYVEKVQRRCIERLVGMKTLSYAQRIHILNLPTLELRRLHNDLVYCYKIFLVLLMCLVTYLHIVFLICNMRTQL